MATSKRLGAYLTILLAIASALYALTHGQPSKALDEVDAAIQAVEALLADTDTDTTPE